MGGFIAILNGDGTPVDPGQLRTLLDVAPFGPERDVWVDGPIGLASSPLRQREHNQDTKDRTRELLFADDRVVIAFDGRLDDRAALRAQLDGDHLRGLTNAIDVELVAAAYARWGSNCPQHLLGDFSFCVWDRQHRMLVAARDHFGVKPLYLARRGHTLIVSNVLRSVRRHRSVSDRLDDLTIGDFLLFGLAMDESRTSFADVGRVPPAHVLVGSADRAPRVDRYWALAPGESNGRDGRQASIDHFADLLHRAVSDRLRGGPAGILMSGGLDSSSIAATAAESLGVTASTSLRAFTGVYDTLADDEEKHYSTIVAASLKIGIDHVPLDGYRLFDRWDAGGLPPEPIGEPMMASTSDLLERAAGHGSFVLAGDGGDPLLLPSTFVSQIGRVPLPGLIAGFTRSIYHGGRPPLGIRSSVRRWMRTRREEHPLWLADPLVRTFDPRARWAEVATRRSVDRGGRSAAINSLLDPWWPSTFETYDPSATGKPVEMRYPFFDVRLVSFALRLPSFPFCVNKHILRSAQRGRLPDVIRLRPKAPLAGAAEPLHGGWSLREAVRAIEGVPGMDQYVDVRKLEATVRPERLFTDRAPGTLAAVSLALWVRHSSAAATVA